MIGRLLQRLQPNKLPDIGETSSVCPHCQQPLGTRPAKKKACPHCGQFIYVRTRPSDKKQVLVTEAQAEQIDEQWTIVNGTHEAYLRKRERFAKRSERLAKQHGHPVPENDVKWSLLNEDLLTYAKAGSWGLYRNTMLAQAELLRKEGRKENALILFLRICYIGLNGPEQGRFNPNSPVAILADGIISRSTKLVTDLHLDESAVRTLYFDNTESDYKSLGLPLSPKSAWRPIAKALFG